MKISTLPVVVGHETIRDHVPGRQTNFKEEENQQRFCESCFHKCPNSYAPEELKFINLHRSTLNSEERFKIKV